MIDYDGAHLIDSAGDDIGTVERTYADDSGAVQMVEVKIGSLFAKHRMVPATDADLQDDGLHVPYDKATIVSSPDVSSAGDTFDGGNLDAVREYYRSAGSGVSNEPAAVPVDDDGEDDSSPTSDVPTASAAESDDTDDSANTDDSTQTSTDDSATPVPLASNQSVGEIRDLGDVIEVPIIEEEIVKRPVVKEVVRIKKVATSDTETVAGDVRREDVEVTRTGADGSEQQS
jgi:hypothetical protein